MSPDPRVHLYDVLRCCKTISEYTRQRSYNDYLAGGMLRDAVERNFITIGEALNRLQTETPEILTSISDWEKIVGFRNVIVYGYDAVNHALVWDVIENHLDTLRAECEALLTAR